MLRATPGSLSNVQRGPGLSHPRNQNHFHLSKGPLGSIPQGTLGPLPQGPVGLLPNIQRGPGPGSSSGNSPHPPLGPRGMRAQPLTRALPSLSSVLMAFPGTPPKSGHSVHSVQSVQSVRGAPRGSHLREFQSVPGLKRAFRTPAAAGIGGQVGLGLGTNRRTLFSGVAASGLVLLACSGTGAAQGESAPNGALPGGAPPQPPSALRPSGYSLPPPEILEIVDKEPNPSISLSPKRDRVLFLHRPPLPPIIDFARPELKLAGIRIDPEAYTRSKMSSYLGITIRKLSEDDTLSPTAQEVVGLPQGSRINFISWAPDGKHIAFTVRGESVEEGFPEGRRLSLWVADIETGQARKILGHPDFYLQTVLDTYAWLDNETLVALVNPMSREPPPTAPVAPPGPKISDNQTGEVGQSRTFTDLLKDEHDADLFEHFTTSQLLHVTLDGTWKELGKPLMYSAMEPSNDGKYILATEFKRPFSFEVPCGRFPCAVHVLRAHTGELVQTIADLPLADRIPVTFNSVRQGRRGIGWRPDCDATLYWVETQDGGDPKVEVSPRDIVYTLPAEPGPDEAPQVLHTLDLRYGGVSWGEGRLGLAYESWQKTRRTVTWAIDSSPGKGHTSGAPLEQDGAAAHQGMVLPQVVFDRSYEDRYSDPGSPMARRTQRGTYLLAEILGEDGSTRLILNGDGATPEGSIPFLDLFDLSTKEKERIWTSDAAKYYESISSILSDQVDGPIPIQSLKVLLSRESQDDPPQYFIKRWRDGSEVQLTDFPHPYPSLKGVSKEIIKYERKDGVQLTGNLYLPPGYAPERDGPLPLIMWAYPREYKSKDAAGQVRGSPNSFPGIGASSPLLFLARGYAVLSGPSMPIIGEGDEEANDSFVEQLVTSAEAAVDEVVRRGVASRDRIAIGGHSYGAFMAANLLAHAPGLFCCGIAQSGAYNRTLTPFSFQQEDRTLWQARDVYLTMSPFLMADKIKTPLLLVHGMEDNNTGTFPMQTERFFAALKGHGATVRMVLLPHEGHGYRARESLLHVLAEQSNWLDTYCKNRAGNGISNGAAKGEEEKQAQTVAAVEGDALQSDQPLGLSPAVGESIRSML